MAKDFRATQVETTKIILSGGIGSQGVGGIIYSGSAATNREGGIPGNMLSDVGTDVFLFVSGTKSNSDFNRTDVTLFGGDVVISGTLYAERQIIEVDSVADGDFFVTGNFYARPDVNSDPSFSVVDASNQSLLHIDSSGPAIIINKDQIAASTFIRNNSGNAVNVTNNGVVINEDGVTATDFRVETANNPFAINLDASEDTVSFLGSPGLYPGTDTAFFVSGGIGEKDLAGGKSIAVFGGDVVISGSLTDGTGSPIVGGGGETVGWFSGSSATHGDLGLQPDWISTSGSLAVTGSLAVYGAAAFNEGAGSVDFRVESLSNERMFIVKGATNRVGIGTIPNAGPTTTLHVKDSEPRLRIQKDAGTEKGAIELVDGAGQVLNEIASLPDTTDLSMSVFQGGTLSEMMRLGVQNQKIVTILSGSDIAVSAMHPSNTTDVSFFVSGAIGSKGTNVRGTSVFGGDVVHSGSVAILDPGGSDENLRIIRGNSGNNYIVFENADEGDVGQIYANTANLFIRAVAGDAIFRAGTTNVVRMTSTGRVGLGNDVSPTHTLHVSGTLAAGFRVDTGNRERVIDVAGDQVLILSGGNASSVDEAKVDTKIRFYVSGSKGSADGTPQGGGLSLFGGDLVVSGNMTVDPGGGSRKIILGPSKSENYIKTVGPIPDGVGGRATDISGVVFRTGFDISESGGFPPNDINFFASGSIGSRGTTPAQKSERGTALFGGDVVISGSLRARQLHYTTHRYTPAGAAKHYVRFDQNGADSTPTSQNKMIAPFNGRLVKVLVRAEGNPSAPGSTQVTLHTNTDTNTQIDAARTGTNITVNMSAIDTTYTFVMLDDAIFNAGDIIGIGIVPTADPGGVNVTAVWEYYNHLD